MTKKQEEKVALQNYHTSYKRSKYHSLDEAYGKFSSKKWAAWKYCLRLFEKYDGSCLRICNRNSWVFTAGFTFTDKETGDEMFCYITPTYNAFVKID